MSEAAERGPNYNWEHEAKHYRDICDELRDLVRDMENSSDRLFIQNKAFIAALEHIIDLGKEAHAVGTAPIHSLKLGECIGTAARVLQEHSVGSTP